ncbi:MAG: fibronectin type III domain-containing protein, partial [bacterium]
MTKNLGLAALMLWVGLGLWSCGKKPNNPVFPTDDQFPPQPRDLVIAYTDREAMLTWKSDNPGAVAFYRIYRRDTTTTVFARLDTAMAPRYVDRGLRSDLRYFYQVSAVNAKGLESKRSVIVAVIPNTFASIIIEAGADHVSQRLVTVKLTAPPRTALMALSNDSLFTNSSWQRFETSVEWVLSFGDGTKTVYAKFRDADGNDSAQRVRDSIILDTTALITNVTENTNGQVKKAGNSIRFTLKTNETGGRATVGIVGGPQGIL